MLEVLKTKQGALVADAAREITSWLRSRARVWFGRGKQEGSIRASFQTPNGEVNPINIWTYGKIEINFTALKSSPSFTYDKRHELLRRLNEIKGVSLREDAIDRYPSLPLQLFTSLENRSQLLNNFDWLALQIE